MGVFSLGVFSLVCVLHCVFSPYYCVFSVCVCVFRECMLFVNYLLILSFKHRMRSGSPTSSSKILLKILLGGCMIPQISRRGYRIQLHKTTFFMCVFHCFSVVSFLFLSLFFFVLLSLSLSVLFVFFSRCVCVLKMFSLCVFSVSCNFLSLFVFLCFSPCFRRRMKYQRRKPKAKGAAKGKAKAKSTPKTKTAPKSKGKAKAKSKLLRRKMSLRSLRSLRRR